MRSKWLVALLVVLAPVASAQVTKSTVMVSVSNCNPSPPLTSYAADVYRPAGAGPFGLVGIGHGFQNSKDNHEVLARELASRGLVVVVPQFPLLLALQCGATDHARNATILSAAMDVVISGGGIDPARLGVAGHSAGGLAAFLVASRRAVAAVVLLDAVDQNNLGAMAVPMVSAPVLSISTPASQCNAQNNSAPWFTTLTGPKGTFQVVASSHCEPQDPVSPVCSGACSGTVAPARQALFKKYAVAFFDRFLNGVSSPCLDTLAAADETAGAIAMVDLQLGGCVAPPDAGVDAGLAVDAGLPDAGVIDADAGQAVDAGAADAGESDAGADAGTNRPANDAGSSEVDAGVDGGSDPAVMPPPAGCGCSSAPALFAVLAVMLSRRRR